MTRVCAICGRVVEAQTCPHCGATVSSVTGIRLDKPPPRGLDLGKPDLGATPAAPDRTVPDPSTFVSAPDPGGDDSDDASLTGSPWKRALLLGALLVILVGAAFGVTRLVSAPGSSGEPVASGGPSTSAPPPSSSSPVPTATTAQSDTRCWDGRIVASAAKCSLPRGVSGLNWVFPSMKTQNCGPIPLGDVGKEIQYQCRVNAPDGSAGLIRYTIFSDVASSLTHYNSKRGGGVRVDVPSPRGGLVRYVWRYPGRNLAGNAVLSSAFVDFPYAFSVEGATERAREDILRDLVRVRRADHLRVR